jgi:hypothetical protein
MLLRRAFSAPASRRLRRTARGDRIERHRGQNLARQHRLTGGPHGWASALRSLRPREYAQRPGPARSIPSIFAGPRLWPSGPTTCPGVQPGVLDPRATWSDLPTTTPSARTGLAVHRELQEVLQTPASEIHAAAETLGPVYERLFEPEQDARQVNDGGVAGGEFFVAGGDCAGFLPASHEAFDNVAAGGRPRGRSRRLARRLRVRAAGSRGVRPGARWPRTRGARTGFLGP